MSNPAWEHANAWIAFEADMNRVLAPVTDVLLDRAGEVSGKQVLDIGCGTGALSFALADAGAIVTASDVSESFLASITDPRVKTLLADAQTAEWPHLFDLVVSRFGVMLFNDPAAAFANMAKALKSGARMLFATWGPYEENPWFNLPNAAAAGFFKTEAVTPNPHASGPFGLSDKGWALKRMQSPLLTDVACETVDLHLSHPDGVGAAADLTTRIGFPAGMLRENGGDENARLELAQHVAEALSPYVENGETRIPARLYLYSAKRV
ncbi:MAG: methyltransferase domain-containing protein [Pseudomonadota bacterium]